MIQCNFSVEELSADSWNAGIWCSLKKYLPKRRSLEGKYASFKNIKFPRGSYQTDSPETKTLYCV